MGFHKQQISDANFLFIMCSNNVFFAIMYFICKLYCCVLSILTTCSMLKKVAIDPLIVGRRKVKSLLSPTRTSGFVECVARKSNVGKCCTNTFIAKTDVHWDTRVFVQYFFNASYISQIGNCIYIYQCINRTTF